MKERPILFSAPMVRAILGGHKTQTRRVAPITDLNIKPHSDDMVTWGVSFSKPVKGVLGSYSGGKFSVDQARRIIASSFNPFGVQGDRLWVREAWRTVSEADDLPPRDLTAAYRIWTEADAPHQLGFGKLRPSMFMPRWASRINLEITGVRVERLNDISEGDAVAEGCNTVCMTPTGEDNGSAICGPDGYSELWESINGAGSWMANPWVWVVEFKQVQP